MFVNVVYMDINDHVLTLALVWLWYMSVGEHRDSIALLWE